MNFSLPHVIDEGAEVITPFPDSLPTGLFVGATTVLFAILLAISFIDIKTLRIPDKLSLPLIAIGLALAIVTSTTAAMDHILGAVAAFVLFAGVGEAFYRLRGVDGLGLGDAKLFAAAGAWLGWQNLPLVLLLATVGGLSQAMLWQRQKPQAHLAFGPWIALAMSLVWIGVHFIGRDG